jgi:hypothetical protein
MIRGDVSYGMIFQNGRIWDGLSLWNTSLDKKFDGVEECYICFAVLHPGIYQLPKLTCQTCKKKFHSACLVKASRHFLLFFNRFVSVQMVQHEQQEFLSHLPQPVLNQIIIFMLLYFTNKSFVDATFLIKVEVVTNRM